jgi:hypothetical protein
MNRHDRELLDRQMSRLPADGILVTTGVFIGGLTAGGLLFTFGSSHPHQRLSTMVGQL